MLIFKNLTMIILAITITLPAMGKNLIKDVQEIEKKVALQKAEIESLAKD